MNYRHGFHAGNFADVLKHVVLGALIEQLTQKESAFAVLDSHAGRGCYDLGAAEAVRTGEFRDGIGRLWHELTAPPVTAHYLERVRSFNRARGGGDQLSVYPGSPMLARMQLRAQDRLIACERQPHEHAVLKETFRHDRQVAVHARDAWEALLALAPPPQKRGLVLIDPPYEPPLEELERVYTALPAVHARFAHGVIALWYPIKDHASHTRWLRQIGALALGATLAIELCVGPDTHCEGLRGSGMLIVNPPWQLDQRIEAELAWLGQRLAQATGGHHSVTWIGRPR